MPILNAVDRGNLRGDCAGSHPCSDVGRLPARSSNDAVDALSSFPVGASHMWTRQITVSTIIAILLFPPPAYSQERVKDGNLEVRTEKVSAGCLEKGQCGDELAVGMESTKASLRYMRGWKLRDAKISIPDESPGRSNVQRMMDMTKSIDYLSVEIEVDSVNGNEAVVFSRQRFSRLLRLPDGKERRRITSVTHRETWAKTERGWKINGFTEHDQTARWEDEAPPRR
jgi:hypothetical protein